MLLILVFNFIGYKFLIQYLENKSSVAIDKIIASTSYKEEDLVEVTVPLQMPYYSDSRQEFINGEINFGGVHYNYVKRQVKNNVLHIWCLPNLQKTKLKQLNETIAKSSNSKDAESKTLLSIYKLLDTDYEMPFNTYSKVNITAKTSTKFSVQNISCKSLFTPQKTIKPPSVG
jgi:hypothetical protein